MASFTVTESIGRNISTFSGNYQPNRVKEKHFAKHTFRLATRQFQKSAVSCRRKLRSPLTPVNNTGILIERNFQEVKTDVANEFPRQEENRTISAEQLSSCEDLISLHKV